MPVKCVQSLNTIMCAPFVISTDVTVSFTNHIYTGNEGDGNFQGVCILVTPQVSFETDLTVSVEVFWW